MACTIRSHQISHHASACFTDRIRGNVLLRNIIIPDDVDERDGRIYCRICKVANYGYDRTKNFRVLAGVITRFENHEKRCTDSNGN